MHLLNTAFLFQQFQHELKDILFCLIQPLVQLRVFLVCAVCFQCRQYIVADTYKPTGISCRQAHSAGVQRRLFTHDIIVNLQIEVIIAQPDMRHHLFRP